MVMIRNTSQYSSPSLKLTMLPQKLSLINSSKDNFFSKNLFHFLKKKLHTIEEISNFVGKLNDEEKYIGSLPDKWRKKFSPSEIPEKTKLIQHLFSDFALESYTSTYTNIKEISGSIQKLQKRLEQVLEDKCTIDYIGAGDYGKVFHIQCASENLALKIYHNDSPTHLLHAHGKTKEIANAVALNYALKPNQRARFYCAKMTLNNEPDSFMLSEFVENKNIIKRKEKFKPWKYKKFSLFDNLKDGNLINGKIVDFGAIDYSFKNQVQQFFGKKLYPLISKGEKKAILEMKEKYAANKDFKELLMSIIKLKSVYLKNPLKFFQDVCLGRITKEEFISYKALGMDFNIVEKYDYSNASKEKLQQITEFLNSSVSL